MVCGRKEHGLREDLCKPKSKSHLPPLMPRTLHTVGTEFNFKFGCVRLMRCLTSCATSPKSFSELPQPESQETGVPVPSRAVPVSKESCIFVSRNLLYRLVGDLPPLRMMGNILGIHWKSFTVCCIHLFVHSANTCEWLLQAGTLLGGGCSKKQKDTASILTELMM